MTTKHDYEGQQHDMDKRRFDAELEEAAETLATFQIKIADEIEAARQAFPPFHSLHEGYAVLLEEVYELEDLVFMRRTMKATLDRLGKDSYKHQVIHECVQIAAMSYCLITEALHATWDDIAKHDTSDTPPAGYE